LEAWLAGGGEMGLLVREKDWSDTPLGSIESWPQSLKTTLGILLHSRYPMFIFWGPHLVKIYNDAYTPILGRKHPWALGRRVPEVWPEILNDIKPLIDRALTGDATRSDDLLLFLERSGFREESYFTFSYSPVSDESGGVGGMFCACTETTARVLGDRRMRTLRDLAAAPADARSVDVACALATRALSNNRADVPFALIYLSDEHGAFRLIAHTGLQPGERMAPVRIRPEDEGASWPVGSVAEARAGTLIHSLPARFASVAAGPWPEAPLSAMVLPLLNRGLDRSVGALVLGVSPRRPLDDDYREWFGLVAAQVSASISNARAAEDGRKRAEALAEIDRAKTAFFSNVSHEFRTPLTLLLGPLGEALSNDGTLHGEALETAHRNALRMLKLVNSLLDFSRLEAGRAVACYRPTDLAALTTDVASVFRTTVETAGLAYTVDCPPLDEPVYVDRDMWENLVLNLVSNAFKHTFEGEISVSLRRAADRAELSVRDTGVGIPRDQLPQVFKRFHRVSQTKSRTHEGTGIGLALVSELVKLHGGRIDVRSTVGHGTDFTVIVPFGRDHLPVEHVDAPGEDDVARPTATSAFVEEASRWLPWESSRVHLEQAETMPAAALPRPGLDGRIVLADDNADMRDYVTRLLGSRWQVEAVGDGAAALAAIQRDSPDLVLADVMMPSLDGFELIRAIRSNPAHRHLPVILLSARAGEEARVEGLKAGADDYLMKPFGARELTARVAATIELSRVRRESHERLSAVNRELADSESRYRLLFDSIDAGFCTCQMLLDASGRAYDYRFLEVNARFEVHTGLKNAAGKTALELIPDLPERWVQRYAQVALTGEPVRFEHHSRTTDRWFDVNAFRFGQPQNRTFGIIFSDVTERKLIEASLRQMNRLKDEFLATLSHELRTPLNAVLGWTHLIRSGALRKDTLTRAFDSLERNAKAQAQLVDDLLDVSRIISGKLQIKRDKVNLDEVIAAAMETIQPTAINKGVTLRHEAPRRTPIVVNGDSDRLRQIAWNLMSNAVKFTPAGGRVTMHLGRHTGFAEIVVRDTGQGIQTEFLPFVFDRFRQADGTAARRHGGLGLGLAIVRHLAEAHGGTVTATSAGVNKGATFSVRLPLLARESTTPQKTRSARHRTANRLKGVRVLTVDDEMDARELLQTMLEAEGARVAVAGSAGEAMHLLQQQPVDVLLADIGMPDEDGFALIRGVRALSGMLKTLPAIAVTAYASLRDRELALEAGYGWHVAKPIDPAQLLGVMTAALDGRIVEARGRRDSVGRLGKRKPRRAKAARRRTTP
jgi:PAS domain S-box-containing protein